MSQNSPLCEKHELMRFICVSKLLSTMTREGLQLVATKIVKFIGVVTFEWNFGSCCLSNMLNECLVLMEAGVEYFLDKV